MSNCMFSYKDLTLTATVSTLGTAWLSSLPLSNLKSRLRGKVARSAGITTAHTKFGVTLATAKPVRMFALLNHNASYGQASAATVTIKLSNVALGNSELGSYAALPFWPSWYPSDIPSDMQETDYWGGTLCDASNPNYKPSPDFWYTIPTAITAKYIYFEIADINNPAGYFQVGRCFVGNGFQPAINIAYGMSMKWSQDVLKDRSIGGVEWFSILSQGREFAGELQELSIAEGTNYVFDRMRTLGQEGECYFIFDPSDTVGLYKTRAMLCRFADESPLTHPYHNATASSFRLLEVR